MHEKNDLDRNRPIKGRTEQGRGHSVDMASGDRLGRSPEAGGKRMRYTDMPGN
ncbi:hypothetical protein [Dyadobacter flavalbus]|uniref:hypothetical protein n=1 Tax=Dyadobacter flavalbus TaxID=2579942 RepID=UPI00137600F2|nr:hypothetical protein [Dyadobacter flavalbus]